MMTEAPMTCALCGRQHPWQDEYWPGGRLFAQCWRCKVKELEADCAERLARGRRDAAVLFIVGAVAAYVITRICFG